MLQRTIVRGAEEDLTKEERAEWYSRLAWEKGLDPQKEARLKREGLFWSDPALDVLDADDRKWEIVQIGFQQVADILESIDLLHLWDYFLGKHFTYGAKLRWMTKKYLETEMTAVPVEEHEKILEACAKACQDENIRLFGARYGDPDRHLMECRKGKELLSERRPNGWCAPNKLISAAQMRDLMNTRFNIPEADYRSIEDWDAFALGIDSSGRGFLFPHDGTQVPPCIRNPQLHTTTALDIVMDWKELRSISIGADTSLCIYDWKKDTKIHEVAMYKVVPGKILDSFTAIDVAEEHEKMALGTSTGHVYMADVATLKPMLDLKGHRSMIRRVKLDSEQQRVATCSPDGYLKVYDLRNGKTIWSLPHDRGCDAMDVDFSKNLALCASFDRPVKLWDLTIGRCTKEFEIPKHRPTWINVNWESTTVCSGAADKVKLWDFETGEVSKTINCHHQLTQCLDVDWQNGVVLTGSWDCQMKLWDLESASLLERFINPRRCLTKVMLGGDWHRVE